MVVMSAALRRRRVALGTAMLGVVTGPAWTVAEALPWHCRRRGADRPGERKHAEARLTPWLCNSLMVFHAPAERRDAAAFCFGSLCRTCARTSNGFFKR